MQAASPLTRSGNLQITNIQSTNTQNTQTVHNIHSLTLPSFPIHLQHSEIRSENKSLDLENYLDHGIIPPTRNAQIQVASLCAKYYIRHGEPKLKEALSFLIEIGKIDKLTFSNEIYTRLFAEKANVDCLIQLLNEHKSIISLDIVQCNLHVSHVANILEKTSIQHFHASNNYFGYLDSEKGMAINRALINNTTLKTLDFSGNKIGHEGIKNICAALHDNHTLTELDISENELGPDGAFAVANMINKTSIEHLHISHNFLGPVGGKLICDALHNNKTVKELVLRANYLGPNLLAGHIGPQAIADLLNKNPYLKEIDISDNHIYSSGSRIIFKALSQNETLKKIHFSGCKICRVILANIIEEQFDHGIYEKIASMLKKNTYLETLDLGRNAFDQDGLRQVMNALIENKTLRNLLLGYRQWDRMELSAIADMLKKNKTLWSLSLVFCMIDSETVKILADALKTSTLEWLDLYGNLIGDGKHDLALALQEKTSSLCKIDLGRNRSDPYDDRNFDQDDLDIQVIDLACKRNRAKAETLFLSESEPSLPFPFLGKLLDPAFTLQPILPRMGFASSQN